MRHLKLFCLYFCVNLKSVLSYRWDYLSGIVAMVIKRSLGFFVVLFIYRLVPSIKGWDLDHLLLLYGFSVSSYALWHCFFINTISIPSFVKNGTLDRFLLRPVNIVFQIVCDGFDEDGWGELAMGILLLIIAFGRAEGEFDPRLALLLPLFLLSSSLIFAALTLIGSSLSFFVVDSSHINNLIMELSVFSHYPLNLFGKALQVLFTVGLPIGFAAYYPVLAIIYGDGLLAIFSLIVPLLFFLLAYSWWHYALRHYQSSGS